MSDLISISILMRKSWRTSEGLSRVQKIATELGLQVTTTGRVSISAKVSTEVFTQLFGVSPTRLKSTLPDEANFGSPGGYICNEELTVPAELVEYVEIISVVPPARRLI